MVKIDDFHWNFSLLLLLLFEMKLLGKFLSELNLTTKKKKMLKKKILINDDWDSIQQQQQRVNKVSKEKKIEFKINYCGKFSEKICSRKISQQIALFKKSKKFRKSKNPIGKKF